MNNLPLENLKILQTSLVLFVIMTPCGNCRQRAKEMAKDIRLLTERKEQELKAQEG